MKSNNSSKLELHTYSNQFHKDILFSSLQHPFNEKENVNPLLPLNLNPEDSIPLKISNFQFSSPLRNNSTEDKSLKVLKTPKTNNTLTDSLKHENKGGENVFCQCRRSRCTKKYCSCFRNKSGCGNFCFCINCKNQGSGHSHKKHKSKPLNNILDYSSSKTKININVGEMTTPGYSFSEKNNYPKF